MFIYALLLLLLMALLEVRSLRHLTTVGRREREQEIIMSIEGEQELNPYFVEFLFRFSLVLLSALYILGYSLSASLLNYQWLHWFAAILITIRVQRLIEQWPIINLKTGTELNVTVSIGAYTRAYLVLSYIITFFISYIIGVY